ncbi:MAG TPA: DUF4364 family protein [Lachnospiraceae bacterium]|nr:DUF4364 family protein [Lachnospiraceae bacterium]
MLYKLIVLYLLNNTKESLTNSQVSEFIVDKGYTDFLTIQLVISELTDTKMIVSSQMRNRTFLTITADGIDTINCLRDRLSSAIQLDIITYLNQNRLNLKNDLSILAHYYPLKNGDYETELIARDKKNELVNLKMTVPTKEMAASLCDNWEKKNEDVYRYLVETLFATP